MFLTLGKMKKLPMVAAGIVLVLPAPSTLSAEPLPDRCAYIYAAATYNMAFLVHKQINELGDPEAARRAHISIQLARNLECPVEPMLAAVDCAVSLVRENGGAEVTEPQAVACVAEAMGSPFPRVSD